ncbi:Corepressor interacting with RBPJ 1 [Schistosoma japonicum]|uniref:CBF1 interacting corepressor n=1 Tax=Schistosoma japonicum TaxID=6182 RepID=Q5DEN5_SCHJA|nr:SJCHGC02913 protein [Schistosoma japonicum]KAH8850596.1 Corepressor interacting with RBPJ 1 [Schistosoma japonicum]KAH8850597.1 Corepressor interacting with RBPJ 1 [Schistosoma japonicum]KAH8850598.1 Corepressor interacting with RBPJ 1 [Schistosoma japonicum]TNN20499.1 Corepressor interacting with RBPJ 1 [Schistosoma japonicum]
MGKGYNNYMCKKFFHPTNFENIKRKWMAEQANEYDTKKELEKLNQYRREQETLENRVLLGDEKARLGLAWMYDQPALMEKEQPEDKEVKFEWQRKYCAPRESYCKNSSEIIDQPFAIEVRNVRCMRCKQWGHLNTDRVCPLFGQSFTKEPTTNDMTAVDQVQKNLQKEGLALKRGSDLDRFTSVFSKAKKALTDVSKQASDEEDCLAMEFLKNLTEKQREKLLKKLSKLSDKSTMQKDHKSKHRHSRRH